jgi:hypothetical protein
MEQLPFAVKSRQQGRVDWMDKIQCSILCNTHAGDRMKYIPESAQCTLGSDTTVDQRSLVHLLICFCTAGIRPIKMNDIKGRFACQQTDKLAGDIILGFCVVEELMGEFLMHRLRISRNSHRRNDANSGSRICSNPGQWISTCAGKDIYRHGRITGRNWHSCTAP